MRVSKRLISLLILISTLLAACQANSPADLQEEQSASSPTPEEATPTEEILPTSTPVPTATPVPSPTPTPPPKQESIAKDTLARLQIIRSGNLETGLNSRGMNWALSPDTRMMAVWGCYYGSESTSTCERPLLAIQDMDTGKKIHELEPLTTIIEMMRFSPDGSVLALAGCHTPIAYYGQPETTCTKPRAWLVDTSTGEITHELKDFASIVTGMVFSLDGSLLYTSVSYFKKAGYTDSTIRIWDVVSGEEVDEIHPDITNCTDVSLGMTPDGQYLVTHYKQPCSASDQVKWWDLVNPSSRAVAGYPGVLYAISPDSTKIAVLESWKNKVLHIYDLLSGNRLLVITPGVAAVEDVRFSFTPDSRALLLTNHQKINRSGFILIDVNSGNILTQIKPAEYNLWPLSAYAFSPDGSLLITYGSDRNETSQDYVGNFSAWDTSTWGELDIPDPYFYPFTFANVIRFSPNQKRLVAWGGYGDYAQLGFAVDEQQLAYQALVDYLTLLNEGDYKTAGDMTLLESEDFASDDLARLFPGIDLGDYASILEGLCTDEEFPCLPLLKVTYQSQIQPDTFFFRVQFADQEGEPALWPPCKKDVYCTWQTEFEYTVVKQPDGQFKIWNTLPYSLYMD